MIYRNNKFIKEFGPQAGEAYEWTTVYREAGEGKITEACLVCGKSFPSLRDGVGFSAVVTEMCCNKTYAPAIVKVSSKLAVTRNYTGLSEIALEKLPKIGG